MNSTIPEIDVHGFKRLEARDYIYQELIKYRKKKIYTIKVIHGWNNGRVIKDWLISSESIKKDLNIREIKEDPLNSGATYIFLNIE